MVGIASEIQVRVLKSTPIKKFNMKQVHYSKDNLKDIYKRLLDEIKMRDQWKAFDKAEGWTSSVLIYQARAEALLDMLENITVYHIGGGKHKNFGSRFQERVDSFKELLK